LRDDDVSAGGGVGVGGSGNPDCETGQRITAFTGLSGMIAEGGWVRSVVLRRRSGRHDAWGPKRRVEPLTSSRFAVALFVMPRAVMLVAGAEPPTGVTPSVTTPWTPMLLADESWRTHL